MVEQTDEGVVLLAVHLVELDGDVFGLGEGFRPEEIGSVVVGVEQCLILGSHHRGELLQVANHEQLHAAEGQVSVAEPAQHGVDGVEQVAPHHGNLVDDEQVERCDDAPFVTAEVELALDMGVGHEGTERQLKEGVDGDTASVDGGDTRWCHDDRPLARPFHHSLQKSGLSRSGFSCEKNAPARVFHKIPGSAQLCVLLHVSFFNQIP